MRSCSLSSRLLLLWICFFLSYYSCDEQEIGASCKYWGLGKHNVLMKNLETNRTQCMRYFFSPLNGWLCLTFYVFTSILISLISFRIWLNENVVRHHRESAMWWYEILARWRSRQRNDFFLLFMHVESEASGAWCAVHCKLVLIDLIKSKNCIEIGGGNADAVDLRFALVHPMPLSHVSV